MTMSNGKSGILVVSPHADDESYGMGGTILKRIEEGQRVFILVVCAGDINFEHVGGKVIPRSERQAEFDSVLKAYGCEGQLLHFKQESMLDQVPLREIIGEIERVQDKVRASTWYIPGQSFHQDHRRVFEACAAAARPTRKNVPMEIYGYETPLYSWNPPQWRFTSQVYENIAEHLDKKIEICELYRSQLRSGILGVQHIREYSVAVGTEAGFPAAEKFEVVRILR
jgi:LmbE family N-acetylglucosaminyl deacetylase